MTAFELAAQMMERHADMYEQHAAACRHMAHLLRESGKFPAEPADDKVERLFPAKQ